MTPDRLAGVGVHRDLHWNHNILRSNRAKLFFDKTSSLSLYPTLPVKSANYLQKEKWGNYYSQISALLLNALGIKHTVVEGYEFKR